MEHNKHEIISLGKLIQNKEYLLKQLKYFEEIKNKFIDNIKDIIKKLNKINENIEILYKINEDIIKFEPKYKNYELLRNLNEIKNDNYFHYIKEINESKDINSKFKNVMDIYDKIVTNDEMRIIYKLNEKKNKIKIFNKGFVEANKGKCSIIYENK